MFGLEGYSSFETRGRGDLETRGVGEEEIGGVRFLPTIQASAGNRFVTSKIAIAESIAFCQTRSSLHDRLFAIGHSLVDVDQDTTRMRWRDAVNLHLHRRVSVSPRPRVFFEYYRQRLRISNSR